MDILWMLLSLAGVLGLFFIMVYAMKKLNRGIGYVNGNRMKVIDRISVGREGALLVVSVAGKLMLIGVSGQHIELLSELDMTAEEYSAAAKADPALTGQAGFSSVFTEILSRKKGENNGKNEESGQ